MPSRTDVAGLGYCEACFHDLVHQPANGSAPRFRCTVCGEANSAHGLLDREGRIVCRSCVDATVDGSAGPATESEIQEPTADDQSSVEIDRRLEEPLPDNVLGKITCPHCWHVFPPDQVLWVSQHADLLGDPVLGPEAPSRFRPSRFNARGEAIDARDLACQVLACPRCHLVVPRTTTETEPLFISIVGAPASGKSHFLASMIWGLRRQLPSKFALTFNDADTISNHSLNAYEETLFLQDNENRVVAIRKTELQGELYDQVRLGQQVVSLPRPFLFTLRPNASIQANSPRPAGAGSSRADPGRVRLLCLYDNAGEHFQPGMDSVSSPGTQHLARSRVLMFLYDPTQHPRFREQCRTVSRDPQLHGASRTLRQETLLTEAALRVRRYTGLSQQKKHDRPLVVILSKADIWAPLVRAKFEREPIVSIPGGGGLSALNVTRVEELSQQLRRMLLHLTPEFVATAEDFCQQVVYLPISALGQAPEIQKETGMLGIRPRNIKPYWVTVPMLYIFAKYSGGLIPTYNGAASASAGRAPPASNGEQAKPEG